MRRFGFKNLMHIVYGLVILLPMFSILGRVIYTQANPNAKDSYSDVVSTKTSVLSSGDSLYTGMLYTISYTGGLYTGQTIYVLDGKTNIVDLFFPNEDWFVYSFSASYEGNRTRLIVYDTNNLQHNRFEWQNISNQFYFYSSDNLTLDNVTHNYSVSLISYSTNVLDNAFDYSISEFTKENNLGNVDMFSWFTNLFLNQDNPKNALYVGFTNWYLNYVLLVSSGYLFFLVLIFFVNYSRKILEKSMYQDYGGF